MFNRACMDPREKNRYEPFHKCFFTLNQNIQLKFEQNFINPFLTEETYEEHRDKMFGIYMKIEGNQVSYNEFLPQRRIHLSIHVSFYNLNLWKKIIN
ncbi:unnamed protein product [Meloidogyne enterolobii]|uniref:Uncharacterized protein n=1 Tax=Meloidogyne enterolobii TaxID=390850 RepID=A0ACB0ZY77_MELEN